jgi:formate hydrogenlyase transcriptional activator
MGTMPPDEQLQLLAASFARARGEDFFPVLAEHLGVMLGAREASICEAAPARRVRTIAVWRPGGAPQNYEYDLAGTPCARVYAGELLMLDVDPDVFPGAPANSAAYFGMPLAAKDGAVLGHLCAWFARSCTMTAEQRAACYLLANRAAAELRLIHVKRERAMLRAQRRQLRTELAAAHDPQDLVGASPAHVRILDEIRRVAAVTGSVLVTGEPGTGKELVARAIHASGARADKPFTRFDCSQLLIEAELATLPQVLAFTQGGTIFFDEVASLAPAMQARLLELLRTFTSDKRAAGSGDVRVIASTSRGVRSGAIDAALLREIAVHSIDLVPLRARVEDIPLLVQTFVQKQARRLGRKVEGIDPDSMAGLLRYPWPGNVRELAGMVERAMVTQQGPLLKITVDYVAGTPAERAALIAAAAVDPATTIRTALPGNADFDDTLNTGLHAVQREHILRVLNATRWVIEGNSGAALKLGLKPATLRHRMKKLGISRAQSAQSPG